VENRLSQYKISIMGMSLGLSATLLVLNSCTTNELAAPIITPPLSNPTEQPPTITRKKSNHTGILILGDSQISFATGKEFQEFFKNLDMSCSPNSEQKALLSNFGNISSAAIGVRSSALHSWTAKEGNAKGSICDVDEKYGVNAGTYGISKPTGRSYVQIGQGKDYQFCAPNKSPLEAVFTNRYYDPSLLVLSFLGNASERWANSPQAALSDVRETIKQIPAGTPCVFMTTAPSFLPEVNNQRQKAQANIQTAFDQTGGRCSFVEAINPKTRSASEGNKLNFATNDAGKVKDPYHPNANGARAFMNANTPALCRAIFKQLKG
jgi:hypothetical protein